MRLKTSPKAGLAALMLVACASVTEAHTWTEQLRRIASNGTFVGAPGYQRGYAPRKAGVDTNKDMVYELNGQDIPKSSPMCKASQQIGDQTPDYGMLTAAPQDFIAMQYEENGHVTLTNAGLPKGAAPQPTRPAGNGTVFVYGTKQPSNNDTYFGIHRVWNAAGTGGDKRGKLLATRYFDDGQCYQSNNDPLSASRKAQSPQQDEVLCQTDVQLPTDAGTTGTYTLYWVWEFPSLDPQTGAIITPEDYTACIDISMTSSPVPEAGPFVASQNVMSKAIEAQLQTAFLVDPTATPVLQASAKPFSSAALGSAGPDATAPAAAPTVTGTAGVAATSAAGADNVVTVTVTETVNGSGPTSTPQAQQPQSSGDVNAAAPSKPSSSKASAATTGAPAVQPFLNGRRQARAFSA